MHPAAAIVLLLLCLGPAAQGAELQWETEWATAFARAAKEDRPVFVDYYATWCVPCRHMEQQVFPDHRVSEQLNRFVLLRIDGEKQRRRALIDGVRGYPTYIVYDRWKTPRLRMTGTRSPEVMAYTLDLFSGAMPRITAAAAKLQQAESAPPHLSIGAAYFDLGLFADAKTEFERAQKIAVKTKDTVAEQLAIAQLLLTRAMQGEARAVAGELEAIAASPKSDGNALFTWMAVARCCWMLGDETGMKAAIARAQSFVPDQQTKAAIAAAVESWKTYPAVRQQ